MGNNTSSTSKPSTPTSGTDSPRAHRREGRNIIPHHTTHRSAAPPEASLAQAQGSTTVASRPKSLPPTAVSSLSGSPHSNLSNTQPPSQAASLSSGLVAKPSGEAAKSYLKDEPSKPVDVPVVESSSLRSHHSGHTTAHQAPLEATNLTSANSFTDTYLTRPPRLPLPIEEEVHTPGSPILGPEDTQLDDDAIPGADLGEAAEGIARKASALSATTVDDEDGEDAEELRVDRSRSVVPTKLEWKRGGDKIYVTGTIFQWNRKQRLHPVEGKPGLFAATIYILPGTHHVRFLVDGIMQTSPDLPTTVDFGNNLVNYIEVNPDDAVTARQKSAASSKAKSDEAEIAASRTDSQIRESQRVPKGKLVPPAKSYRGPVPQYLLDFDQPEESAAYQNAVAAIEKLPTPPSLPGFLGKPILNAATLLKDDNSVLNMPNHTVLNHLATSSIKNNVLAVSATTRYRDKYVTTIIHKPSTMDVA